MTSIPWAGARCIVCHSVAPLSVEHLVPEAIGGTLTCAFLCKNCNSRFGHGFEADAKADPAIRLAIRNLSPQLPKLYEEMESGQPYSIDAPPGRIVVRAPAGRLPQGRGKLSDGSLLVPTEDAADVLATMTARDGHPPQVPIAEALLKPIGRRVAVTSKIEVINWGQATAQQSFAGAKTLNPLVPLKIAYEFLAVLVGEAIRQDIEPLNRIRGILLDQNEEAAAAMVKFALAKDYSTFHGIVFEGNDPFARVQVRFFGKLAHLVTLPNLRVTQSRYSATVDLVNGKTEFENLDER